MENLPDPSRRAVKSYRDLIVWQQSIDFARRIYLLTENFPPKEVYGLTSQLRRATVSIPSDIAEGQARQHSRDFTHFLYIALGSLAEIDTQLVLSVELDYMPQIQLDELEQSILTIRRMLYGLINHLPSR